MKKTITLWLAVFFLLITVVGCSPSMPATEVIVNQSALCAEVGERVLLPSAQVQFEGEAVVGTVKCTVYNGKTAVAEYNGTENNEFIPTESGVFVAEYQAEYNGGRSAIKQKKIVVFQGIEPLAGVPRITVDRSDAFFASYSDIVLRPATGASSSGEDISGDVKVVLLDAFSRECFSGKGNTEQKARPMPCGTYLAVYTLENGGMTAATSYVITVISEENAIPEIQAPTSDLCTFVGHGVSISTARAADPIEGDVSSLVKVRIEDGDGKIVFPDTPADKKHEYVFSEAGEYRVVYTCKNSRNKAAASTGYRITVLGSTSSGIVLDGIINESEYGNIPSHRDGLGGNVNFYFHRDAQYLYVAATVKDRTLTVSKAADTDTALNTSDGLEVLIDPKNSTQLNLKNSACIRIRIGADGRVLAYSPKSNAVWQKSANDMSGNAAVKTEGTVSYTGITKSSDSSASDLDTGYTVETRIPWSFLGFTSDPFEGSAFAYDYIGIAFGHRDVSSPQYNVSYAEVTASGTASANNSFYNGMHYINRGDVGTTGTNPSYYSKLYLRGDAIGVNPVVYSNEVILDGYMETEFWQDAERIPYGLTSSGASVDAFVKTDRYGVYVGVYIHDTQMVAEPRGFHGNRGIKFNDRLDLRIADESTLSATELPKAASGARNITKGKIFFLDPTGAVQMHMLQTASGRSLMQLPYAYGTVTNGTVGYSKNGNLWSDGMFIADTDVQDVDKGWGSELFIPWSTLEMEYPKAGETCKIGILVSVLDRNADPTDNATVNSLRSSEGRARSILAEPNSYYVIETKGEVKQ